MPTILIVLIWIGTVFNTYSTFNGFGVVLQPSTLQGDILCFFGTFLVMGMALATGYIMNTKGISLYPLRIIWGVAIFSGIFCALMGNVPTAPEGGGMFRKLLFHFSSVKAIIIIFLTFASAVLSMMHSTLPEAAQLTRFLYRPKHVSQAAERH